MFPRPDLRLLALSLCAVAVAPSCAQMHHVEAPERVTRAVGVYEWTGALDKPSAARFVPVSLFIDGRFEDADLYLARPVPFALQDGNLYTVERAGEPEGVLDLQMAERVVSGNALADDDPTGVWYGFGKFTPEAPPRPGPPLHKSAHPGVIQSTSGATGSSADSTSTESGDSRPHMSRRSPASDDGNVKDSGSKTADAGSSDDTDRPTLARRDPAQDAERRRTAAGGKRGTASVSATGPAPGDDPDRPTLTHKTADTGTVKELTGMPADLHQAVAVSDPVSRDPHPFARAWDSAAERTTMLATLQALSKPLVEAYLTENRLVPSLPRADTVTASQSVEGTAAATENGSGAPPVLKRGRPAEYGGQDTGSANPVEHPAPRTSSASRPHSAAHASSAPAPLSFGDEHLAGFTLSYGGLPTFVYTAHIPVAEKPQAGLAPAAARPTAYLTVVVQRLLSGQMQVAFSSVTDSQHLDRTPRLDLIDAVDPDASHRASLLFQLRGSSSRQFALYRLVTAHAENTFTTASIE